MRLSGFCLFISWQAKDEVIFALSNDELDRVFYSQMKRAITLVASAPMIITQ
jgi:hypothetical protein